MCHIGVLGRIAFPRLRRNRPAREGGLLAAEREYVVVTLFEVLPECGRVILGLPRFPERAPQRRFIQQDALVPLPPAFETAPGAADDDGCQCNPASDT